MNGTRAQEQDVGFECRTCRSGADFGERSSVGVGSELAGARRVCQVLMAGAGGGYRTWGSMGTRLSTRFFSWSKTDFEDEVY